MCLFYDKKKEFRYSIYHILSSSKTLCSHKMIEILMILKIEGSYLRVTTGDLLLSDERIRPDTLLVLGAPLINLLSFTLSSEP